jgi:hypothetical protein
MPILTLDPIIKPDPNKLNEAYEVLADVETQAGAVTIRVPKFFQFDGSSIQSSMWQITGTPFNPRFMYPSVFHDWIYHVHQVTQDKADDLLYRLLVANKVNKVKAWLMYEAVRAGGIAYWENDKDDKAYIPRLAARVRADGRDPMKYGIL